MTARNRRRPPDVQEIFALHLGASRHLDHLLEDVQRLQRAGKIGEARKVLEQAEAVRQGLRELEAEIRPRNPHDPDRD